MRILNVRKIKTLLAASVAAFAVVLTLSLAKARKTPEENVSPPVLQPAPDNLMRRTRIINILKKSNGSFYADGDDSIVITDESGNAYRVDKAGDVSGANTSESRSFLSEALEEIAREWEEYSSQAHAAIESMQTGPSSALRNKPDTGQEKEQEAISGKPMGLEGGDDGGRNETSLIRIETREPADGEALEKSAERETKSLANDGYISLDTDIIASSLTKDDYSRQNSQDEKRRFLERFANQDASGYLLTQNDIAPGTIVPLTLITGINSDLPGIVIAQTDTNIYDTLSGTKLLIAKGSKVIASYDSRITYGQQRILIAWTTLIRSDGYVLTLPGFHGTDSMGRSGYAGKTDNHLSGIIGASLLSGLANTAGLALSDFLESDTANIVLEAFSDSVTSPAAQLMEKSINLQPTITIEPGASCKMLISETIRLPEQASS